jgi:hypothetical protein
MRRRIGCERLTRHGKPSPSQCQRNPKKKLDDLFCKKNKNNKTNEKRREEKRKEEKKKEGRKREYNEFRQFEKGSRRLEQ